MILFQSNKTLEYIKGIHKGIYHTHGVIFTDKGFEEYIEKAVFGGFWAGSVLHVAVMIDCSQFGSKVLALGEFFHNLTVVFTSVLPCRALCLGFEQHGRKYVVRCCIFCNDL